MKKEERETREERLLRLLESDAARPGDVGEQAWLQTQQRLSKLLHTAHPEPRPLRDGDAFYRSIQRHITTPAKAPLWWPMLNALRRPAWAAALACALVAAVVWWPWTGIDVHRGPVAIATPNHETGIAGTNLSVIDEIDSDMPVITYQLPDSLTPVVLFTWSAESENHAPSG